MLSIKSCRRFSLLIIATIALHDSACLGPDEVLSQEKIRESSFLFRDLKLDLLESGKLSVNKNVDRHYSLKNLSKLCISCFTIISLQLQFTNFIIYLQ